MAGYLIYIPGARTSDDQLLRDVGLGALVDDRGAEWSEVLAYGPDDGRGMLAGWRDQTESDPLHGVNKDKQEWTPAPPDPELDLAKGRFWVGVEPGRPVTSDDLKRKKQYPGEWVELADGNLWHIPVPEQLPHRWARDPETGEKGRHIAPQFADYWERSAVLASDILYAHGARDLSNELKARTRSEDEGETTVRVEASLTDAWDFADMALQMNYRICDALWEPLGILDEPAVVRLILAAIQSHLIVETEVEKKRVRKLFPSSLAEFPGMARRNREEARTMVRSVLVAA